MEELIGTLLALLLLLLCTKVIAVPSCGDFGGREGGTRRVSSLASCNDEA